MKPRLLVLCTANSARSQMGEGLLRAAFGDRFDVHSAGTHASFVRPEAIQVMAEIGIDISGHRSKSVAELGDEPFAVLITVCDGAREQCPVLPGAPKRIHWSLEDPALAPEGPERLAAFRRVRDELRERIRNLVLD